MNVRLLLLQATKQVGILSSVIIDSDSSIHHQYPVKEAILLLTKILIQLAHLFETSLETLILEKLTINEVKYPIKMCTSEKIVKYTEHTHSTGITKSSAEALFIITKTKEDLSS